jgi:hypothetical protein
MARCLKWPIAPFFFFLWKCMCLSYPSCLNVSRTCLSSRHEHPSPGPANLWHAAFTALPKFLFRLTDQRLYIMKNIVFMCVYIYIYIYIYYCVEIVYQLTLLPNNMILRVKYLYTKRKRCEALTGYLSLGRRPGGDWANTWHWTKRFTICFSNRK